ncbi:MAG: N-acetylmuramic acid 6-phosphate etherase [Bacteroidota bacterium]
MPLYYLGLDIGGTWIKGSSIVDPGQEILDWEKRLPDIQIVRVKSPLDESSAIDQLTEAIKQICRALNIGGRTLGGIGISTGGIVDYAGKRVTHAAGHLTALKNSEWIEVLEEEFKCPVSVINDADAASIGLAELGLLRGDKTVGIMPVGTGLGFAIWRNGRRWRPGKNLTLLGSIRTPSGFYDGIASASKLAAEDAGNNLIEVLTHPSHSEARDRYIHNLVDVINTAGILYNLDEVMICGGLTEAASACNFPLEEVLNSRLGKIPVELDEPVMSKILDHGNRLQLIGAISLAMGEAIARENWIPQPYDDIKTEVPWQKDLRLEKLSTPDLTKIFWETEQEAGRSFEESLPIITEVADHVAERLNSGGRVIYVGAGTSGRIAAMDTVEIPSTYGFPEDRILCLIAGGIADASIEIESDFEKDASAVPEILLLNITAQDVVIGITASGTAYYVKSALAFAKHRGALSVMIQRDPCGEVLPFYDFTIPMNSGNEVVAGSTRMKAGTATKKILNIISSSVMIKMANKVIKDMQKK